MSALLITLLEKVNEIITLKQLEIAELQKKGLSISKGEFKLKSYLRWTSKIKNCLNSGIESLYNLTSQMDAERKKQILHYLSSDYGFKKSLLDKIELLIDKGEDVEFETTAKIKKSLKKLNIDPEQSIRKLRKTTNDIDIDINDITTTNDIDITNIEAIPKKLAEEGLRPNDNNPIAQAEYDLRMVYGVGPVLAKKLVKTGMRLNYLINNWDDLLNDYPEFNMKILHLEDIKQILKQDRFKWLNMLTHHQLLGIKYFKDITIKIPRIEVSKIELYLQKVATYMNNNIIIQCCGSYRRGRDRSGDADALMTHKLLYTIEDIDLDRKQNGNILTHYITLLTKLGFLKDHLTEGGNTKYMGFCKLPNKNNNNANNNANNINNGNNNILDTPPDIYNLNRRIDIRFVPYNSYGTALLYFTGSKNFNTAMRRKALKMGYTLSEYGLYKTDNKSIQIPTPTEEDVFKILEMKYKTPAERDM